MVVHIPHLPSGFSRSPKRWRIEKWIWTGMTVAWIALYFLNRPLFDALSILYVICISHWALVLGASSTETASEARDSANGSS
jgi:hypothetical protein